MVVAGREESFPAGNHKWRDFFQLMVIRLMGQVHAATQECKAAGGVKGGAGSCLHKWAGQRVHFMKAGKCEASLRGQGISGERASQSCKGQ